MACLVVGCGSAGGTMRTPLQPNAYPFAVVAAQSVQPEGVARLLIERGYRVVAGSEASVRSLASVPPMTVLLVNCQYLGHTGNALTGTAAHVACTISDFATGEEVYAGTGKYMGITTESDDIRGAVSRALASFPNTGRAGSLAQASSIPAPRSTREATPRNSTDPTVTKTGTGFYVDTRGHVLTNAHVVDGCAAVRVRGHSTTLRVVRLDKENDLAVLSGAPTASAATFREGRGIRPGDQVGAVGYPLIGVLASEANVTTGGVSALAGIADDSRFLQITAPVQPGSSGGPLLDSSGNVVGVVTSKLDVIRLARATGDIAQNINFALNASVARILLDGLGVEYRTAPSTTTRSAADVADAAKSFTLPLECVQ